MDAIAQNVWGIEARVSLMPGMSMPARATVLRLANGDVVLHSPTRLDDAAAAAIAKLGPVRAILAPNMLHWMYAREAKERFPEATLHGAPGLEKKLGEFTPLPADGFVAEGLRCRLVEGAPKMNEHVFLFDHSLVVSDLVMNLQEGFSALMSLLLRFNGVHKQFAHSRMWKMLGAEPAVMTAAVAAIAKWDFERVIPAHGRVQTDDAHAAFRRAFGLPDSAIAA